MYDPEPPKCSWCSDKACKSNTEWYAWKERRQNGFTAPAKKGSAKKGSHNVAPKMAAATQKARGVEYLSEKLPARGVGVPYFQVYDAKNLSRAKSFAQDVQFPTFARPCPTRPRHGFVESRVVNSMDELRAVAKETYKADKQGEVLLMLPIQAKVSGILTPSGVAIGAGTDGATSGSNSILIPLAKVADEDLEILQKGPGIEGTPYLEWLFTPQSKQAVGVQLRDGPTVSGPPTGDYIPESVKVERVLQTEKGLSLAERSAYIDRHGELPPETDLLAWEKQVQSAPPGTAIWCPGHTRLSHYAVHGIATGRPVFFGPQPPEVGKTYTPTEAKLPEWDVEALAAGIKKASNVPLSYNRGREYGSLAVLLAHQWSALRAAPPEGHFWIGVGAALVWRLGAVACLGEARHCGRWCSRVGGSAIDRDSVYERGFTLAPQTLAAATDTIHPSWFRWQMWGSKFEVGYGGYKWGVSSKQVRNLYTALDSLNGDQILSSWHAVVTACHNGGRLLSKFGIGGVAMDKDAEGRLSRILSVIPHAWTLFNTETVKLKTDFDPEKGLARKQTLFRAPWVAAVSGAHTGDCLCYSCIPLMTEEDLSKCKVPQTIEVLT